MNSSSTAEAVLRHIIYVCSDFSWMNSNSNAEAVLRHSSPQGNTVAINLNSNSTAEAENWSTDNSQQTTDFWFWIESFVYGVKPAALEKSR